MFSFVQGRGRHGHGYEEHQLNAKVILDVCHTLAHPDPGGPHHITTDSESAEIREMLSESDPEMI